MIQPKTHPTTNLYDEDFVAWADEQALLLEQKRWSELDLVNLVEEVRDLGRRVHRCPRKSISQVTNAFVEMAIPAEQKNKELVAFEQRCTTADS